MSGRPEEFYADYDATPGYDEDAWQEFTPWRPGDPSTAPDGTDRQRREAGLDAGELLHGLPDGDRAPEVRASGLLGDRSRPPGGHGDGREHPGPIPLDAENQPRESGHHRHYREGDQVRNNRSIHGMVFEHVPEHTQGRVVDTETSLLGDHWSTVRFDNGHTETVRDEYLDRRGLFD